MIQIYNIDCMEYMKTCKDKQFNLAIVDPPYGIMQGKKMAKNNRIDPTNKMNDWNYLRPGQEYFNELFRISDNVIIWGANNFILPETEYFIIWDKMQTVPNFASAEYAWSNVPNKPAKVFRYSIHQFIRDRGSKIHPTEKPVKLYKWLLHHYASPGWKIFDSHFGSGSHGIACRDMGFDLTACEIDEHYYTESLKNLAINSPEQNLFT